MDCTQRRDLIFLHAAGALDAAESAALRDHLAGGCPQCAGYLAEAHATLAMLPLALDPQQPPALLKQLILNRAKAESRPARTVSWDRIVMSSAVAAVLAVAVTLGVVKQFWPTNVHSADDVRSIAMLQTQLTGTQAVLSDTERQLDAVRKSLRGMQFAMLTGPAQPTAVGRVFLDSDMKKWYFFTCGMKPAADGKTYELWLISNGQKIPAGTFDVNDHGVATLLGSIPPIPPDATISLCVTDEPAAGPHQVPTGTPQMRGTVE